MNDVLENIFEKVGTLLNLRTEYITPKQAETNHLEFKQKRDTRTPELHEDDKKNFSVAVSSFSNAEGGLLIWGIATGTKDSREYAKSLKPIKNVDEFAERLRSYLLDAVMPSNPAVRIKTIKNRQGNGFALCLIRAAQDVPVRSMTSPREYWIRSDGRNVKLEHYQIKDIMLRQAHPDLEFNVKSLSNNTKERYIELEFSFINSGKAIAKHSGWFVQIPSVKVERVTDCKDVSETNNGGAFLTRDLSGAVLHPNGITHTVGKVVIDRSDTTGIMLILAKWYCEDMSLKESTLFIKLEEIEETQESNS